ncbi:MAG: DUF4256 domain-containing protein [Povalibacter sp.]
MKAQDRSKLIRTLKDRFEQHMHRHEDVAWDEVEERITNSTRALDVLHAMEKTGGEPDVIGREKQTGQITYCDCARESPTSRRSLCYDRAALDSRKQNKPPGCATEAAAEIGIELLTEDQYRALQQLDELDTKTSSWIKTPDDVRSRGGALFCDRRYGRVFLYHNGAESYYAARGFRGLLVV